MLIRIKEDPNRNGSHEVTPTSEFRVVVGVHDRLDKHEAWQRRHSVERAVVHDKFAWVPIVTGVEVPVNDIMLLKLSSRIQFNKNVRPICVDDSVFPAGTQCMATGWGRTHPTGNSTHTQT